MTKVIMAPAFVSERGVKILHLVVSGNILTRYSYCARRLLPAKNAVKSGVQRLELEEYEIRVLQICHVPATTSAQKKKADRITPVGLGR